MSHIEVMGKRADLGRLVIDLVGESMVSSCFLWWIEPLLKVVAPVPCGGVILYMYIWSGPL